MAYKDEYEVARLYSDAAFARKVEGMFEGGYKLKFHLAPPIFNKPDPRTGEARKSEFGPWMMAAFRVLAKLKRLARHAVRCLRGEHGAQGRAAPDRRVTRRPSPSCSSTWTARIGSSPWRSRAVPEHIRGFGHVKRRHLDEAKKKEVALLTAFRASAPSARAA